MMKIDKTLSDADILIELGKRIKACRIRTSCTQSEFAESSGVSKGTIANAENGESIQLGSLLKILRELDALNSLEIILPSTESTPMELIRTKSDKARQRVRKHSTTFDMNKADWKWGEDK